MRLSPLTVLSDSDIKRIHDATLDILETCGVKLLRPATLAFLKACGLPVDQDTQTVFFPRNRVADLLGLVPNRIEVFDREGQPTFVLGDGTPRLAAGHNAVFWLDSDTGETRPSTVADVERFARICEGLEHIDMLGIPVMPQDIPVAEASLLYGVRACIEHSRKPIYYSTDNALVNRSIMDMLEQVFPGPLEDRCYGIGQLSPTSPLYWESGVLEALTETVERNVPLAILPEPNAGISAPYTLAGLLTLCNAECLSGVLICQLIRPGARVLYANSWTTTDMRTGYALVGSAETSVCRIAGAQLARFYGIPSHTTAPNSDNHAHDEQNAWEKTLSTFCALGAGNDLIVNCGMFATGLTCSHEQLVMDEEIGAICRRIAAGVDVDEDTIARELIEEVGPGGTGYMTALHTLLRLRSAEHHAPRVAVRGPRAVWEKQGAPDTAALARAEADRLAAAKPALLDNERRRRLAEIVNGFSLPEEIRSV
jgi:trimethylamine--corrinoid protein Co-methyltransferase